MNGITTIQREHVPTLKVIIEEDKKLLPKELIATLEQHAIANDDGIWLTYLVDNFPIALLHCTQGRNATGRVYNLEALVVFSSFRKQGIATQLLQYLEEELLSRDANQLVAQAPVTKASLPIHSFLEKHGFHKKEAAEGDKAIKFSKFLRLVKL